MTNIILIETSTELCSVAIASDGKILSYRESSTPRSHASLTAVFVNDLLKEASLGVKDCSAVCVSMGPGSYTGLRVGVSTAKGLCFASGIPLIAVGTLDTLVWQGMSPEFKYIVPMIDARRMEVYTSVFSPEGKQLTETQAKIVDGDSFSDLLSEGRVLFIGDGAEKCSSVITHPNATFTQCCPKASSMLIPAFKAYSENRFEDVAYFEPFYLKNFVATTSRKKLF